MAKRPKWKIGDVVRVLEPKEYVRCGYPMFLPEVAEDIYENHSKELHAALAAFGLPGTFRGRVLRKLAHAMAYAKIDHEGFGSKHRQIFEKDADPSCMERPLTVIARYHVMTGEYYPPSGGGDHYEPGGLFNQKLNTILVLNSYGRLGLLYPRHISQEVIAVPRTGRKYESDGYLHIWDKHVERVTDEPTTSPSSS